MSVNEVNAQETAQLVRLAQAGDEKALDAFLRQMHPMIYFLSLKLLGNKADAEDMTQDVYVKILKGLPSLRDPAAAPAWVKRIVETSCINSMKKAKAYVYEDEEQQEHTFDRLAEESVDALPGEYMDMYAKRKIITQMIDELPEKQRNVVYLYYYSELSVEEIAQLMEISPGTVKSRLSTARAAIRTKVEDEERKGNKLYIFFPFLGRMLREESRSVDLPPLPLSAEVIAAEAARYGTAGGAAAAASEGVGAAAASESAGVAAGAAAAAGKAATGLGVKLVAGLLTVALIGGAAVGLPTLLGGGEKGAPSPAETSSLGNFADGSDSAGDSAHGTDPDSQGAGAAEASPIPTEEAGAVADFDPEALLGQNLSVLTDRFGEPDMWTENIVCQWYGEDWAYSFAAELFPDGETIRGMHIDIGPAILGIQTGDSADAAQEALAALGRPGGVFSVELDGGMTVYRVNAEPDQLLYSIRCMNGSVIGTDVSLNSDS